MRVILTRISLLRWRYQRVTSGPPTITTSVTTELSTDAVRLKLLSLLLTLSRETKADSLGPWTEEAGRDKGKQINLKIWREIKRRFSLTPRAIMPSLTVECRHLAVVNVGCCPSPPLDPVASPARNDPYLIIKRFVHSVWHHCLAKNMNMKTTIKLISNNVKKISFFLFRTL